jgi:quercetin dioxygenase-like cupin family protein
MKDLNEIYSQEESSLKAVRLFNTGNGDCTFQTGHLLSAKQIKVQYFFAKTNIESYQKVAHPAPRLQFVITLKGKLRFKVTNGDQFIIEPGTILLAEDVEGEGHTWELIEGDSWQRLYIPYEDGNENYFVAD